MQNMKKLKRDPVKYIRDRAKSKYEKESECYICGTDSQLDFHHFYSLAPLLRQWLKVKIQELRDAGEKAHSDGDHSESEKLLNEALDLINS